MSHIKNSRHTAAKTDRVDNQKVELDSDAIIKEYASQLGVEWNCGSYGIPEYGHGQVKDALISELVSLRTKFLEFRIQIWNNTEWEKSRRGEIIRKSRKALNEKSSSGDYLFEELCSARKKHTKLVALHVRKFAVIVDCISPSCEMFCRRKLDAWISEKKKLHPELVPTTFNNIGQ